MYYALLIYEAENLSEGYSAEDEAQALAGHRALQQRSKADHAFVEANQLLPASVATTVTRRGGETIIMDGPFAETKELLIGLYVMQCADLDEAIDYASQIPHAGTGSVEVRPMAYFERAEGMSEVVWSNSS
jgi:hypothetical protein